MLVGQGGAYSGIVVDTATSWVVWASDSKMAVLRCKIRVKLRSGKYLEGWTDESNVYKAVSWRWR